MALTQSQAVDLQQALQQAFHRSGDSFVSPTVKELRPDDYAVQVEVKYFERSTKLLLIENIGVEQARHIVKSVAHAFAVGEGNGREVAILRVQDRIRRIAEGQS